MRLPTSFFSSNKALRFAAMCCVAFCALLHQAAFAQMRFHKASGASNEQFYVSLTAGQRVVVDVEPRGLFMYPLVSGEQFGGTGGAALIAYRDPLSSVVQPLEGARVDVTFTAPTVSAGSTFGLLAASIFPSGNAQNYGASYTPSAATSLTFANTSNAGVRVYFKTWMNFVAHRASSHAQLMQIDLYAKYTIYSAVTGGAVVSSTTWGSVTASPSTGFWDRVYTGAQ